MLLILGENGSGKSAYAESLVRQMPNAQRVYIATMLPYGEEGRARVEKHRAQRAGDGYETIEAPRHLAALRPGADAVVLLEDVANLVANILFDTEAPGGAAEAVWEIESLRAHCQTLVIVSIHGLDGAGYTGETRDYIAAIRAVNEALFLQADTVVEIQDGRAAAVKGTLP